MSILDDAMIVEPEPFTPFRQMGKFQPCPKCGITQDPEERPHGNGERNMNKRTKPLVTFTLSLEAIAKLEEAAERTGRSKSSLVDEALRLMPMPKKLKPAN